MASLPAETTSPSPRPRPRPTHPPARSRGPIVVPFSLGSATPRSLVKAADGLGELVFVVASGDPAAAAARPMLEMLAPVIEIPLAQPADALAALDGRGIAPGGTVTFLDSMLPVTAAIAERHGLPGLTPASAARCTEKFAQRTTLNAAGVGDVQTHRLTIGDPIPPGARFPAILKPARGAASVNTVVLDSAEAYVDLAGTLPRDGGYVLEELLLGNGHPTTAWLGDYCSVESAVVGADVQHLGICDRTPVADPARETGIVFPSAVDQDVAAALEDVAAAAIGALGITDAIVHTEIKHTATGPRVIEVNARLGGQVDDLMQRAGVCEPIRLALEICLGIATPTRPSPTDRVLIFVWALPPLTATRLLRAPDPAAVRRLPGVVSAQVLKRPGSPVDWRDGTLSAHLGVTIEADDHEQLGKRSARLAAFLDRETEWQA